MFWGQKCRVHSRRGRWLSPLRAEPSSEAQVLTHLYTRLPAKAVHTAVQAASDILETEKHPSVCSEV